MDEDFRCERVGCDNEAVAPCAYRDRRGRACARQWCLGHLTEIAGAPYCERHASTVTAVGFEAIARGHLPELGNRVPSLVHWVGSDLDTDVCDLLGRATDTRVGETLVTEPVTLVTGGGRTMQRRWERNWKLVSHTGISDRVTLQVHEDEPITVVVRVGQRDVVKAVPPWIQAHALGETLSADQDAAMRRGFYRAIHNAMVAAVR
jgi:hypothetical protein